MNNIFVHKGYYTYLYKGPSNKLPVVSEILYGEYFKILSKNKNWIKIKTSFDNYIGYIKDKLYVEKSLSTHKIYTLKARIFTKPSVKKKYKTEKFLSFASRISIIQSHKGFIEYEKNKWIKQINIRNVSHIEKDYVKILKLFLKAKYVWGGKTFRGIDCSALLQLIFFYNNRFYPRDTIDQIKYLGSNIKKKIFKKGDIIFWKGHVAICINNKELIHAFGPKKKVVLMNIKKTIIEIKKNSELSIISVKNINAY